MLQKCALKVKMFYIPTSGKINDNLKTLAAIFNHPIFSFSGSISLMQLPLSPKMELHYICMESKWLLPTNRYVMGEKVISYIYFQF